MFNSSAFVRNAPALELAPNLALRFASVNRRNFRERNVRSKLKLLPRVSFVARGAGKRNTWLDVRVDDETVRIHTVQRRVSAAGRFSAMFLDETFERKSFPIPSASFRGNLFDAVVPDGERPRRTIFSLERLTWLVDRILITSFVSLRPSFVCNLKEIELRLMEIVDGFGFEMEEARYLDCCNISSIVWFSSISSFGNHVLCVVGIEVYYNIL